VRVRRRAPNRWRRTRRSSRARCAIAAPWVDAHARMTPRKCLPGPLPGVKKDSTMEQGQAGCASDSRFLSLSGAFRAAEAPSLPYMELPVIRMKLTGAPIRCRANDITSCESSFQPTRPLSDREVGLNARAVGRERMIESSARTLGPAQKQVWQPWIPSRALTLSGTGALAVSIPAHTFWRLFFRQEVASS
jgi:hypothetical protein